MLNTWLVIELEQLQTERDLTAFEHSLLDEQYEVLEQYTYQEVDVYGDMHHY